MINYISFYLIKGMASAFTEEEKRRFAHMISNNERPLQQNHESALPADDKPFLGRHVTVIHHGRVADHEQHFRSIHTRRVRTWATEPIEDPEPPPQEYNVARVSQQTTRTIKSIHSLHAKLTMGINIDHDILLTTLQAIITTWPDRSYPRFVENKIREIETICIQQTNEYGSKIVELLAMI